MISKTEMKTISEIARKYKIGKILLFGSAAEGSVYNDIDIAVSGIEPELFFSFYGEVLMALSKPVDIINLDHETSFVNLIRKEGIPIYG
jgi:uncharacterized protein